jgi:hypothetical protein
VTADERTDFLKIIGCAKGRETVLADGNHISFHLGISNHASKLLGYFAELFELLSERMGVVTNIRSEHVH